MSHRNRPAEATCEARTVRGLYLLFAFYYFLQGIAEPSEGLVSQPIRSLLVHSGRGAADIAAFGAWLVVPWAIKPVFGLVSDGVPLLGSRRRSYLSLSSLAIAAGFFSLARFPPSAEESGRLLAFLFLPATALAMGDVAADGLMVETGQPRGLTGRFQSIQWASIYSAGIFGGAAGGWLSRASRPDLAYLFCGVLALGTLLLTLTVVHEPPANPAPRELATELRRAARTPKLWGAAAFLFLWNFDLCANAVLYFHLAHRKGIGEEMFGACLSLLSAGCVAGSAAYGMYCRRLPFSLLIHLAIVAGMGAASLYLLVQGPWTAAAVSLVVGVVYITGILIQLDLAARVCPPQLGGTIFAMLLGLSNASTLAAAYLGGRIYQSIAAHRGVDAAFATLATLEVVVTASCWLLAPLLIRSVPSAPPGPPMPMESGSN